MYIHRNVIISKAGGKSGSGTKNYKINIPVGMIKELGITEEDRSVILICEDGKITIKKSKGENDMEELKVKEYDYLDGIDWRKIKETQLPGVILEGLEKVIKEPRGITCVYTDGSEKYYDGTRHGEYVYQPIK